MAEKEKNDQKKVRMNISISREIYEWITKTRGNASKIAERAYYALFSASKNNDIFVLDLNTLKLGSNQENKAKIDAARRDRTGDLGIMSPAPENGVISGKGAQNGDENFSTPADKGVLSMAEFMLPQESEYRAFKQKYGTDPKTIDVYWKDILKLTWVKSADDIKHHIGLGKHEKDAIYQVCSFIDEWLGKQSFNGELLSQYRKQANNDYKHGTKKGSHKHWKSRELISHPEVVRETLLTGRVPDDVAMFSIMCVFGCRVAQLIRLYEKPLKISFSKDKSFFWIDAGDVGKGHKKAFFYFFPSWMLPIVKSFKVLRGKTAKEPDKAYESIVNKASRKLREEHPDEALEPCNLSSLRKLAKTILTASGIPDGVAEFTQGRLLPGTGAKDYDSLETAAKRDFGKTLPYWEEHVPIADWMKDEEECKKRIEAVEDGLEKQKHKAKPTAGHKQLPDAKRKKIIELSKKIDPETGKPYSQRKIAEMVKAGRETVTKVLKGGK